MRRLVVVSFLLAITGIVGAQAQLDDPRKERAKGLFGQLRCVVCQNQSILDSDADVAKDLRMIVNEQIAAGRTDAEIKKFLVDRYGEFVLLRPAFSAHTLILWAAPALFFLIGIFLVYRSIGRTQIANDQVELSDEEKRKLNELLDGHEMKR